MAMQLFYQRGNVSLINLNRRGTHLKICTEWAHGLRQAVAKPLTPSKLIIQLIGPKNTMSLMQTAYFRLYFEGTLSKLFKSLKYNSDI